MASMKKTAQSPPAHGASHLVRARWRLFLSAALAFGFGTVLALTTGWRIVTSTLVGWDIGVGLYLVLCFWMFSVCDEDHIRRQSVLQDEGRYAIPVLTVIAALASLAAILVELRTSAGHPTRDPLLLTLAIATILLSWTFIHTIFTLHYAHEYYADGEAQRSGLDFPGNEKPGYWDFAYFSFVIGMTSQVSDVCVTSSKIRQIVAAHGLVSFVYNVALLALTINIAASAL
jgi:uncharacterized membrane protein